MTVMVDTPKLLSFVAMEDFDGFLFPNPFGAKNKDSNETDYIIILYTSN